MQNSNAQIVSEYAATCQSLNLAQKQLAHLAERANQAALAYEFKDDELKRTALDNEKIIKTMNEKAEEDKVKLEKTTAIIVHAMSTYCR